MKAQLIPSYANSARPEAAYLAISQTAPAPTAVMATDIASAVAMSLTHSQIDTVQFQSALFLHLQCWKTGDPPLEADAHGAMRFTVAGTVRQPKVRL